MNFQTSTSHAACGSCQIRHRAVCARCDADELALLERMKSYRNFSAGQTIVWAGEQTDFVGTVVTGVATLTQTLPDGRRQMVGLLQPSDFLGRPDRAVAVFDVTAATDLMLCCFQRKPFAAMMDSTPNIAGRLLEMTLDELDAARAWMVLLGRKDARERIATLLALLGQRAAMLQVEGTPETEVFQLPLTREVIADYVGLTPETVSRQIGALKRDGLIRLHGSRGVSVPDMARLLDEAGDDAGRGDGGGAPH